MSKVNLTKQAIFVLEKRYLKKNERGEVIESPEEMFERVARTIAEADKIYDKEADIEKTYNEFLNVMEELKFIPNSPTLMNAGRELGQLSACFVLPVGDSLTEIFDAIKYAALIHQSGGGTGFSFSRLRPKGDIVKSTMGVASGPVSFMKIFDVATDTIKQGGVRRGANMGILRVDHPDIEEFITVKDKKGVLTNFNISVAITDEFMRRYFDDEEYELVNPRDGKVWKKLRAKYIFDMIAEHAWKTGDPGVIFIDTINKYNPTPNVGEIESTNPCVVGDTLVATDEGLVEARELKKGMRVWNGKGWNKIKEVINNGIKKIYKITLKSGLEIRVTPEHKLMTENGWREVRDLKIHDKVFIPLNYPEIETNKPKDTEFFELIGYFIGDGSLSNSNHVSLHVGSDLELVNHFSPILERFSGSSYIVERENQFIVDTHVKQFAEKIRGIFGIETSKSEEKEIPKKFLRGDTESIKALLRGIFSSDGTVYESKGTITVALSSSSKKLLKQVQILLLYLGIPSTLTKEKKGEIKTIKGKTYKTNSTYRVLISGERAHLFFEKIGFIGEKKEKFMKLSVNKNTYSTLKRYEYQEIISIEEDGEEEVFDITAPPEYTWITNGILSMDCGEQPLLPYESCNLGSIDVSKFAVDGKIDYESLGKVVRTAVHFLDNVIDVNKFPLPEIERETKGNRKIGLGVMGFHDLLIKLRIPYNSEEALKVAEDVMSFINREGWKKSEELAEERGVFPNWKGSVFEKEGRRVRNATVTTIAPTGSISIIAGCSSGIEPLFALAFKRKVAIGEWNEIHPIFERELKERGIYSEELMEKVIEEGSIQNIDEIPEDMKKIYVTAHDIHWEWHVKMQAAFQKYTDNAVSKTVNLPHDAKVEDIKNIYLTGYKLGLKGITVYRDRSKETQVLITGKEEEKGEKLKPRPRPKITFGATIKMKTGCGNLYVTINEDENGICEVFSTLGKAGGCAASQTEAISRLISLALRSGIDPESIVDQLKGIRCPNPIWQDGDKILSCADAIAKAIEKYLSMRKEEKKKIVVEEKMEEESEEEHKINPDIPLCPECGTPMISVEGCFTCPKCGYSKCD